MVFDFKIHSTECSTNIPHPNPNPASIPATIPALRSNEVFQMNRTNHFPDDFLFGVSTSAFQVEGAWNIDGKGPSIWDEYIHSYPEKVVGGGNGDDGPESYKYYLDDIAAVKHLNVKMEI